MPYPPGRPGLESEISGLTERSGQLRQAAALPGADLPQVLEAAFAELDGAIDALNSQRAAAPGDSAPGRVAGGLDADRRLLQAIFQQAPVPMFLLDHDGTVRRANRRAGDLLGFAPGYATGKHFGALVGLPARAAAQTHLAAAHRTGEGRQIQCDLLGAAGPVPAVLDVSPVSLPGGPGQLIVAVTRRGRAPVPGGREQGSAAGRNGLPAPPGRQDQAPAGRRPASAAAGEDDAGMAVGQHAAAGTDPAPGADDETVLAIRTAAGRLDLLGAATRLVLENATVSESVMLQRCARLLAGQLAAWVIVDIERGGQLRRQFAIGPQDERSAELARSLADADPPRDSAPRQVHDSGTSLLTAHTEDTGLLGTGADGVPFLSRLDATSVLSVPLSDGERSYGALTLARVAGGGYFGTGDVGLVEEIGEHLALAIRVDRLLRQRSDVADALRAGLRPPRLPAIPGVEIAAAHQDATASPGPGGDFYSVYRSPGGWGVAIGDVAGKGEGAAAVTAAARHAIRVAAHWCADPAEVLRMVNEIMLAEEFGGRFVTADAVHLQWRDRVLRVTLGSAGHPLPVLLRQDGRVQTMNGHGLPLGIFPDPGTQAQEVELSTGDTLFFYTDGLADARGSQPASFGDRLTDELAALAGKPAAEVAARMQQAALAFCGGELRDDMTVLVLRAGEPPGRDGLRPEISDGLRPETS
jgi:serine phosphatase RsbU (regulator of sigma subunit)/PAS domain-containing protein